MLSLTSFIDNFHVDNGLHYDKSNIPNIRFTLMPSCLLTAVVLLGTVDAHADVSTPVNTIKTKQTVIQTDISQPKNTAVARGAYIARAADCAGCHGEDYTGGVKFVLPMGTVVSTNITSSKTHGIGGYSLQQFSDAVRYGQSPSHNLYPAMPYPAYRGMSTDDIRDLYAFMQTVEAVDSAPKDKTEMKFPFNMRILMTGYNLINLPKWDMPSNLTDSQKRGKYLVDNLGHCGDCHTPRTNTMGYDTSHYLAGAMIQGMKAPNITTDNETGIGLWSKPDIVKFLRTGELQHHALAGGEMGKVVTFSLQHLTDNDLSAIADYLKTVPAIKSGTTVESLNPAKLPKSQDADISYNLLKQIDVLKTAQVNAKPNSGEALYLANCASCHGINGQSQLEAQYPNLIGLSMLRETEPRRLIQVIAHGSESSLNTLPKMPAFANSLSDEQIASITNYVRTNIGGMNASQITASDVKKLSTQDVSVPFLIANAGWLMILGIIVGLLLLVWLLRTLFRRY